MGIHLAPGFQANIQIRDKEGTVLYQQPCQSSQEVNEFIQQNGGSKEGWSLIRGTIIPLRTQNFKVFSKDFFLPTFVNFSLKINNIALRIIASVFAIALDVITAPIRLLTTPFRVFYNDRHPETRHPLVNLIEAQTERTIDDNFVNLFYEVQDVRITNTSTPEEQGNTLQEATRSTVKGSMRIALKTIPGGVKRQVSEQQEAAGYLIKNGKWVLEGISTVESSIYCRDF